MTPPLTLAAVVRWLETVGRTYGPDVPLWLADAAERPALRVRLGALLLTLEGGTPAVLLLAPDPHDAEAQPW